MNRCSVAALLAASVGILGAAPVCSLSGTVKDPAGSVVPDVLVTLGENRARTDSQGEYKFTGAPCGAGILRVADPRFEASERQVLLLPHQPSRQDVSLAIATVAGQINVIGDARDRDAQRISVVPRETLLERSRTVLTEIARQELGVHELRTAPAMGAFFIRGLTGKNVAVYRDGIRYTTSAQRGGVSTFQNLVDPGGLEAVEFVRGPDSARYGSDSLGGAVNLQSLATARGEFSLLGDTATAGFGGNLLAGLDRGRFSLVQHLAARRVNTVYPAQGRDPHSAVERFLGIPYTPGRLPDTAFTQYGGSLRTSYRLTPDSSLIFLYERSQQDNAKRYDQLLGGDGNLIANLRNLQLDFGYLRYQAKHWRAGISRNAQREERQNQGGQGNPNGTITHQYEKLRAWGLHAEGTHRFGRHQLAAGVEGYREEITAPAYTRNPVTQAVASSRPRVPNGARYLTHGVYLQDAWRAAGNRLHLFGALRFGGASYRAPGDSLAANGLTGRAGASYRLAEYLAIRGQYSRGFRVPNVTDLGTLGLQGNGFFEANPNDALRLGGILGNRADDQAASTGNPVERLRPEVNDNFEAGVTFEPSRMRLEVTAFRMNLGNSIVSQTLLLPPGAVGRTLGDQVISRQIASGAVFVPAATQPVLVRANYSGARYQGVEQSARIQLTRRLTLQQNLTWVYAQDAISGYPPDLEPGVPPLTVNPSLVYARDRFWIELYGVLAARQPRLSSLALSDRRIGASRSRAAITNFFNNGARVRGITDSGRLVATGETAAQVVQRVLGNADSAPLFTAIPGYGLFGARGGFSLSPRADFVVDASNLTNQIHRGIGWGIPGPGRAVTVRCRYRW